MHEDSKSPEAYSFYHKHLLFQDGKSENKVVRLQDDATNKLPEPKFCKFLIHLYMGKS